MSVMAEFLMSVASVIVAGLIGLPLAIRQLRRERAFDRRLEWGERAWRGLYDVGKAYLDLSVVLEVKQDPTVQIERAKASIEAFRQELRESQLYASPDTVLKVKEALSKVHEALKRNKGERAALEAAKSCYSAADELGAELRTWLGLKPLARHTSDTVTSEIPAIPDDAGDSTR